MTIKLEHNITSKINLKKDQTSNYFNKKRLLRFCEFKDYDHLLHARKLICLKFDIDQNVDPGGRF